MDDKQVKKAIRVASLILVVIVFVAIYLAN